MKLADEDEDEEDSFGYHSEPRATKWEQYVCTITEIINLFHCLNLTVLFEQKNLQTFLQSVSY